MTKKKPLYVFWATLSRLKPEIVWKCSTPGVFLRISSTFLHAVVRALEGGGVGEGHVHEEVALTSSSGRNPGGRPLPMRTAKSAIDREEDEAEDALPDEGAADGHVALGGPVEHAVEPREEGAEGPVGLPAA